MFIYINSHNNEPFSSQNKVSITFKADNIHFNFYLFGEFEFWLPCNVNYVSSTEPVNLKFTRPTLSRRIPRTIFLPKLRFIVFSNHFQQRRWLPKVITEYYLAVIQMFCQNLTYSSLPDIKCEPLPNRETPTATTSSETKDQSGRCSLLMAERPPFNSLITFCIFLTFIHCDI